MNKLRISQKAYDNYEDAVVTLFMEHYAAALTECLDAEAADTQKTPFPEELDQRCRKLIKQRAAKQHYLEMLKTTKCVFKAVAVFALVVLAVTSVLFMSVDAFREHVVNYYISRGDGYWSISMIPQHEEDLPSHTITFNKEDPLQGLIPQDYKLTTISNANDRRITAIYENAAGEGIRFISLPSSVNFKIDTENTDVSKEIILLNHQGILTIKNGVVQIAWWDTETSMIYLISADRLTEDVVLSIAEQLVTIIDK